MVSVGQLRLSSFVPLVARPSGTAVSSSGAAMLDLMSISTSWGLLAPWPALAAAALYVTTNERIRWVVRCQYQYPHLIGYATVAACLLVLFAFAATLTLRLRPPAIAHFTR